MKTLILALAATAALGAGQAAAASPDEVVRPSFTEVKIKPAPAATKGAGPIVTSEVDGRSRPASLDGIKIVRRPVMPDHLRQSGGR